MEHKIINCTVSEEYILGAGECIGRAGSHDETALVLEFRDIWCGLSKTLFWTNADGTNGTKKILTPDMLQGGAETYRVPVPYGAKTRAGMAKLTIRGVMVEGETETVCAVAEGEFEVMEAEMPEDYREQLDIEATAAEQIMAAVHETSEMANAAQTEAREAKEIAVSVKEGAGAAAEEVAQALQNFDKAISDTNERVNGVEQEQTKLTQSVNTLKSDTETIKKDVADLKENGGGIPGTPGKDGLTPYIKDGYWWIGEENTNVKAEGKDGKDGYTPIKGKDYFDGKDGYTPIKGVDYFTASDKAAIVQDVLAALPYYDGTVEDV